MPRRNNRGQTYNKSTSIITLPKETHIHCSNKQIGKMCSTPSLSKITVNSSSITSKVTSLSATSSSLKLNIQSDNNLTKFQTRFLYDNFTISSESDFEIYSLSDVSSFALDDE